MQSLLILGRQPALGIAELESLYGNKALRPVGQSAALLDVEPDKVDFRRLGGSVKLAKVLTAIDSTQWQDIARYLFKTVPEHLKYVPEGKLQLGISAYDMGVPVARINATGLELKKIVKKAGRTARVIPNKTANLNSAQVLHNKLTGANGWELVLVRDGNKTLLAQTAQEQDIEAYAARDQARPKRDAKVGMLPPKLAQIIVNLAGSHALSTTGTPRTEEEAAKSTPVHPGNSRLLDPFCGTGVVLQEALLLGYDVIGSDLDLRMVQYSQANLDWLATLHSLAGTYALIEADATSHQWPRPIDLIACETYLGRPFSAIPRSDTLREVMQDVHIIHRKFLKNIASQTQPGFRMCIAVPAWKSRSGFQHLKTLDSLEELGYNRVSFVHAKTDDLLYYREGQIVARELVALIRK